MPVSRRRCVLAWPCLPLLLTLAVWAGRAAGGASSRDASDGNYFEFSAMDGSLARTPVFGAGSFGVMGLMFDDDDDNLGWSSPWRDDGRSELDRSDYADRRTDDWRDDKRGRVPGEREAWGGRRAREQSLVRCPEPVGPAGSDRALVKSLACMASAAIVSDDDASESDDSLSTGSDDSLSTGSDDSDDGLTSDGSDTGEGGLRLDWGPDSDGVTGLGRDGAEVWRERKGDMVKTVRSLVAKEVIRPAMRRACRLAANIRSEGDDIADEVRALSLAAPAQGRPGVCVSPFLRERVVRDVAVGVAKSALLEPLVQALFAMAVRGVMEGGRATDLMAEVGTDLRNSVLGGLVFGVTGGVSSAVMRDIAYTRAAGQVRGALRGGATTAGGADLGRLLTILESQHGAVVRVSPGELVLRSLSRGIVTGAASGLKKCLSKLTWHPLVTAALTGLVSSIISSLISKVLIPRLLRRHTPPARPDPTQSWVSEKKAAASLMQNSATERIVASLLTSVVSKRLVSVVRPDRRLPKSAAILGQPALLGSREVLRKVYSDVAGSIAGAEVFDPVLEPPYGMVSGVDPPYGMVSGVDPDDGLVIGAPVPPSATVPGDGNAKAGAKRTDKDRDASVKGPQVDRGGVTSTERPPPQATSNLASAA